MAKQAENQPTKNLPPTNLAEDIFNLCDFGKGVGLDIPCDVSDNAEEPPRKTDSLEESPTELTQEAQKQNLDKNFDSTVDLRKMPCNESPTEGNTVMGDTRGRQSEHKRLQALFDEVCKESEQLSTEEQMTFIKFNIIQLRKRLTKLQPPALPNPDPTGNSYPIFKPGSGITAFELLESQWGQWLACFNDSRPINERLDRDYVYQDDLKKLDPKLIPNLRSYFQRLNQPGKSKKLLEDYVQRGEERPAPCNCDLS